MQQRTIVTVLSLAAAVLGATPARGQETGPLGEGSRVRVTAPSLRLVRREATVDRFYADTVFVRVAGDSLVAIPRGDLTRVEVPVGRTPRPVGRSALIGAGVGVLAGLVLGVTCADPECPPHLVEMTAAGGAATGALVGAAVGALQTPPEWDAIDPRRLRGPSLTLGLSLPAR
ncbi:MAG: hypothetical protein ACJ8J0_04830 [Longimicrobiaceae bacterium]